MYISRVYRLIQSSYYSISPMIRLTQRSVSHNAEDEINREANALSLLTQIPRVYLKMECYRKISKHLGSGSVPNTLSEFVEVASSDLKKLVKDSSFILTIVDENSNPPLMEVSHRPTRLSNSARRLGIQADKGERTKTIQIRSNIDDHMLAVRVKQVEAFVNTDNITTVIIRLPKITSTKQIRATNSERNKLNQMVQDDEKENRRLAELSYNIQVKRFTTAFSTIPQASVQVLNRPGLTEIALLIRPSSNK